MMSYSYLYDGVLSGFRCFKEIQVIAQKPHTHHASLTPVSVTL